MKSRTAVGYDICVRICALVILLPLPTAYQAAECFAQSRSLASRLQPLIKAHRGDVAVAVKHLKTGETFYYRENVPMPTASLIKFPVMVEAYRQTDAKKLDLDRFVELKAADKVPGSGILTKHFSPGAKIRLRDAIRLMIVYSDNTATNLVLDQIGIASVDRAMQKLGLPNTKINAKVFRRDTSIDPAASRKFGLGSTTAKETIQLYEMLYRNKLAGGNKKLCGEMREHLYLCEDRMKLARFLPPGTKFAHKGGAVTPVRTDGGVMETPSGPIAVCVLTANNRDKRWIDDNAAQRLCAAIGRTVFRHFNPRLLSQPAFTGVLKSGGHGFLVQALQRTLNARLKPSPKIAVDGEFGPETVTAVKRFQKEHKLKITGVVDAATWPKLGILITAEKPLPSPSAVNGEVLQRAPAEKLTDPPPVTCKAWAIADGKTGKLLSHKNGDKPLDIASTTKMMTAYIVTELARKDPKVLDEVVTYSVRADNTPGSTSGLLAGERATVREVLYGLMLPSGNDASVALAEHFGNRLSSNEKGDPLDAFVAEMNRTAKRLGMKETHYRNPHGLTVKDHKSSARDLAKLAFTAMQNPLFRRYVGTRQHGTTVTGLGGYRRNVVWRNTNQLLKIDGYSGVKTGTTTAAGACLVSYGERNGQSRIVVVLGAVASPARYTDARNLFRWAWK
jgi:serine-type D-Ala-D-Ala carboxypeptidase (penicillin-binding protein 5/6)